MDMRQHGQGIEACMFGDGCLEKHTRHFFFFERCKASFSQEWTSHLPSSVIRLDSSGNSYGYSPQGSL